MGRATPGFTIERVISSLTCRKVCKALQPPEKCAGPQNVRASRPRSGSTIANTGEISVGNRVVVAATEATSSVVTLGMSGNDMDQARDEGTME